MSSGANKELLQNARANIVMKLNNSSTYESWLIIDTYIESLQQENQQLKIQISAREQEYKKLEKNWNELKKWLEKRIKNANNFLNDSNKNWDEDARGYVLARKFELEEMLKVMQELDGKSE